MNSTGSVSLPEASPLQNSPRQAVPAGFALPSEEAPLVFHTLPPGFEFPVDVSTAYVYVHATSPTKPLESSLDIITADLARFVDLGATPLLTHHLALLPPAVRSAPEELEPFTFSLLAPPPPDHLREPVSKRFITHFAGASGPIRGHLFSTGVAPLASLPLILQGPLPADHLATPGPGYDPTSDPAHPHFIHNLVHAVLAQPFVSLHYTLYGTVEVLLPLLCPFTSIRHLARLLFPASARGRLGPSAHKLLSVAPPLPAEPPHRALLRSLCASFASAAELVEAVEAVLGPEPPYLGLRLPSAATAAQSSISEPTT